MEADPLIEGEPEQFLNKVEGFDVYTVHFCENMLPYEDFIKTFGDDKWEFATRWLADMRRRGYRHIGHATFYGDPSEEFYAAQKEGQIQHALDNNPNYKDSKDANCMWYQDCESTDPVEQQRWIRDLMYEINEKMK